METTTYKLIANLDWILEARRIPRLTPISLGLSGIQLLHTTQFRVRLRRSKPRRRLLALIHKHEEVLASQLLAVAQNISDLKFLLPATARLLDYYCQECIARQLTE